MNCRMEALKLEMRGDGHQKKGNSLFGEVDDRRMEIERKMISLKVRYETLEKTYATTQHQLRKMKVHVYITVYRPQNYFPDFQSYCVYIGVGLC